MKLSTLVLLVPALCGVATVNAQTPAGAAPASLRCVVTIPSTATDADRAFNAGNYPQAEELFAAQVSASPGASVYAGLVRSQLEQQKVDSALANATKAVAALPASAETHTALGEALERDGQIPEASAEFTKALGLDRCAARAHYGAGSLFRLASMHAAAQREFNVAHQLAPEDPEIGTAWVSGLAPDQQGPAIQKLLARSPAAGGELTPDQRYSLEVKAAIAAQGKSCHLASPVDKAVLEMQPLMYDGIRTRNWGLEARINDRNNFLLELDTTVSGVVLSRSVAAKSGVMPIVRGDESGNASYMAYADSIRIGKLELRDCPVKVVSDDSLVGQNSLISPEVFADHAITINFATRTLTLAPLPARPAGPSTAAAGGPADRYIAPEMQNWSRVYLADGRILMPTQINKSKPFLFMLDTGAPLTIVSPPVASAVLSLQPDSTVGFRGVSSDIVKVYRKYGGADTDIADIYDGSGKLLKVSKPFKAPIFDFARVSRLDDLSFSFDLSGSSRAAGVEVSGLIGFSVLQDLFVSIDYRDGLINLVFDSNYLYRTRAHTY